MMSVKVINNANNGLNRLAKNIVKNGINSVEDATTFASMKWKELIPKKSGRTASNIYKTIEKKNNSIVGKVISPALIKPNNFYLNVFLEKGGKKGGTSTVVKNRPYNLRRGYFGAASLTTEGTKKHFKGMVETRVNTSVRAFNK